MVSAWYCASFHLVKGLIFCLKLIWLNHINNATISFISSQLVNVVNLCVLVFSLSFEFCIGSLFLHSFFLLVKWLSKYWGMGSSFMLAWKFVLIFFDIRGPWGNWVDRIWLYLSAVETLPLVISKCNPKAKILDICKNGGWESEHFIVAN